jgi:flagellar basal body P-ring formation protein FlgA
MRAIKLILLNFIKAIAPQMTTTFPHFGKRGKACGSVFSCFSLGNLRPLWAVLGWLITSSSLAAVEQQIDQSVRQHLQQLMTVEAKRNGWQGMHLSVKSTPLTNSHPLAPCPSTIQISGGSIRLAHQQLTLGCLGTLGWPIKVSTELQIFLPVIISTDVINRGDTIRPDQLQQQEMDITRATRGFYHHPEQAAGMRAKRRIRANQMLSPDLIDQPLLVKRGEKVNIVANQDGISATTEGEVLENGSKDEVIRVKNLSSHKIIDAKVLEAGLVTSTY